MLALQYFQNSPLVWTRSLDTVTSVVQQKKGSQRSSRWSSSPNAHLMKQRNKVNAQTHA